MSAAMISKLLLNSAECTHVPASIQHVPSTSCQMLQTVVANYMHLHVHPAFRSYGALACEYSAKRAWHHPHGISRLFGHLRLIRVAILLGG